MLNACSGLYGCVLGNALGTIAMKTPRSAAPSKNGNITASGRFQPGNTLGRGRPAGSRNKASLAIEALLDGEAEKLTRKCIELALDGDAAALRLCMERIAPARRGRPISINLPPIRKIDDLICALSAVIAAMASGEITPDEAATAAGIFEVKRKTLEMAELEQRMVAIEKTLEARK
jgi:hypothetical protein